MASLLIAGTRPVVIRPFLVRTLRPRNPYPKNVNDVCSCEPRRRTSLSPRGEQDDAVRWIAIRHGDDHIHLVAMLARQDRQRVRTPCERYRVREACRAAEDTYGLTRTAPGDRIAARRPTRAETEKAHRTGWPESARVTLKRHVATAAAAAASEQQFFTHLTRAGVLVRTRLSTRTPGQVTGYAVALPGNTTKTGAPVWYSGGKLAADLTLPKLRHRWGNPIGASPAPGHQLTWAERDAIRAHAARTAADATGQIRHLAATDPAAAADAAWAAADTLRAADAALGSRVICQAADTFDRAARAPYARLPRPTPAGNHLRHAARSLSALGLVTGDRTHTAIALVLRLAALADAIADLRQIQQRAAQAKAARTAAERLRAAVSPSTVLPPRGPSQARPHTATGLARTSFPAPASASTFAPQAPDQPTLPGPATVPRRGTTAPRPRGPAR